MERTNKPTDIERFIENPPQIILVFDNFRGKEQAKLAAETMEVRAAIGALVYHSNIYGSQKPILCSFAGEHEEDDIPGSYQVAHFLENFKVDTKKLEIRRNTITTTTDLMELHALMRAKNLDTAAIVTTDDHVDRTETEIKNHFDNHGKKLNFYVLSPSSKIVGYMVTKDTALDLELKLKISNLIKLGQTADLDGGLTELIARTIAKIPIRSLRLEIQKFAENASHSHTPDELVRIQKAAQKFKH